MKLETEEWSPVASFVFVVLNLRVLLWQLREHCFWTTLWHSISQRH